MYPIIFHPIYKEMVWGGQKMSKLFNRTLPFLHTGESWDITCRPAEMGVVSNGPLSGKTFLEIVKTAPEKYLGKNFQTGEFPLLVKIIDANDNLSVQVHPNDEYAKKFESYPQGKNEMWYILDAPEGSTLVAGLRSGVSMEDFAQAAERNRVEECLHHLPIKKGDVINIPSGLVHAITKGVMVAEIQQNSDITYRMYDYNRVGLDGKKRELHLEKALAVSDFDGRIRKDCVPGLPVGLGDNQLTYYIANRYFAVIHYKIASEITENSDPDKFYIFTCLEGEVCIRTTEMTVPLPPGGSAFIPAAMGGYRITGKGELLKSFVPDIDRDFIRPLKEAGFDEEDIFSRTACDSPFGNE